MLRCGEIFDDFLCSHGQSDNSQYEKHGSVPQPAMHENAERFVHFIVGTWKWQKTQILRSILTNRFGVALNLTAQLPLWYNNT